MYYSGNDCEIKAETLIKYENGKKSTVIIAIVILSVFWSFFPLNDIINLYIKSHKLIVNKKTNKKAK